MEKTEIEKAEIAEEFLEGREEKKNMGN